MKKINLLKHQGMSLDAFKKWLNQLIADKKGALPDLNDWKLIKENLDKVKISTADDDEFDGQGLALGEIDGSHWFESEKSIVDPMPLARFDLNILDDLQYFQQKVERALRLPASYLQDVEKVTNSYNTVHCIQAAYYNNKPVTLDNTYGKTTEEYLNGTCKGK